MKICYRCLGNDNLIHLVRSTGRRGRCDVCGENRQHVLPFSSIGPLIRNVAQCYYEVRDNYFHSGDPIEFLLQSDWNILSDELVSNHELVKQTIIGLLAAGINYDHDDDPPNYSSGTFLTQSELLSELWRDRLEEYLTSNRRMSLQGEQPGLPDVFEVVFEDWGREYPINSHFYRARVVTDRRQNEPFPLSELGAPPEGKPSSSRVSEKGVPVLYVASDASTALAEVRPWLDAAVAIANIRTTRSSRVVDLCNVPDIENPFEDELIVWKVQLQFLFDYLSYELSMPVIQGSEQSEYAVSQQLCHLMREAGYDGVTYQSSLGSGTNTAFFDVKVGEPTEAFYLRLVDLNYRTEPTSDIGPFYPERLHEELRP